MYATRAAVEEGILPGGGVALLRAVEALKRVKVENEDQKHGIDIVRKALSWPARRIALNAGEDGFLIVGQILEEDQYNFWFLTPRTVNTATSLPRASSTRPRLFGRPGECSVDRRASDHHGSHGRRKGRRRTVGPRRNLAGGMGVRRLSPPSIETPKARYFFRPFFLNRSQLGQIAQRDLGGCADINPTCVSSSSFANAPRASARVRRRHCQPEFATISYTVNSGDGEWRAAP